MPGMVFDWCAQLVWCPDENFKWLLDQIKTIFSLKYFKCCCCCFAYSLTGTQQWLQEWLGPRIYSAHLRDQSQESAGWPSLTAVARCSRYTGFSSSYPAPHPPGTVWTWHPTSSAPLLILSSVFPCPIDLFNNFPRQCRKNIKPAAGVLLLYPRNVSVLQGRASSPRRCRCVVAIGDHWILCYKLLSGKNADMHYVLALAWLCSR